MISYQAANTIPFQYKITKAPGQSDFRDYVIQVLFSKPNFRYRLCDNIC